MGNWLGTGYIANQERAYRPFSEARVFVRGLGLQNQVAWRAWTKSGARPDDIPANAYEVYKEKGWVSWGDWLGTGRIAPQDMIFRPFEEARTFVRALELQNQVAWRAWAKSDARPDDIPADPEGVYKDEGWTTWSDWLGTRNRKGGYRPFLEARAFVHKLGLNNKVDWSAWATSDARPDDIPAAPRGVYEGDGWAGWGDWLGTGRIANQDKVYCPFQEARAFVRSFGLQGRAEWNAWAKSSARPDDIPAFPEGV